jgi:hypothetical protein
MSPTAKAEAETVSAPNTSRIQKTTDAIELLESDHDLLDEADEQIKHHVKDEEEELFL